MLIAYAVLNIAGIPDNADALRDYLLPLGAYVGRIVGIAVLVAVLLSLVPAKARAWLWARRQGALPVAEVSTGVLADIEHRGGCPRAPARMETYKTIRERDGIEITTGKCNDCGAMAYRHSADPVAPPVESVDHERRLTRANSVLPDRDPLQRKSGSKGSRQSPLAAALVHERRNGRKWLSGLGVSAMASMFSPRTTEADVLGWEARVHHERVCEFRQTLLGAARSGKAQRPRTSRSLGRSSALARNAAATRVSGRASVAGRRSPPRARREPARRLSSGRGQSCSCRRR